MDSYTSIAYSGPYSSKSEVTAGVRESFVESSCHTKADSDILILP